LLHRSDLRDGRHRHRLRQRGLGLPKLPERTKLHRRRVLKLQPAIVPERLLLRRDLRFPVADRVRHGRPRLRGVQSVDERWLRERLLRVRRRTAVH
jgi:hypothetical protein